MLFTALHAVLTVSLRMPVLTAYGRDASWWPAFQELFFLNFDWEMMTYWTVIGASHAFHFHRLDPAQFARIHRSRIVNTDGIKEMQPWFDGDYSVILRDGTRLTLSRGSRDRVQRKLGKQTVVAEPGMSGAKPWASRSWITPS